MRALLVVNTFATQTSIELSELIAAALQSRVDLTVVNTEAPGDATTVAKEFTDARSGNSNHSDNEVIIALGGDGTSNEIANGILSAPMDSTQNTLPILAALPGGNANVYSRNLGFHRDAIKATAQLLRAIDSMNVRTMDVGLVSTPTHDRYFLFNAGYGLDAAVVARMQEYRASRNRVSDARYLATALQVLANGRERTHPHIQINEYEQRVHFAIVTNMSPWTYLGKRAIDPAPRSTGSDGLSVIASTSMSIKNVARLSREFIRSADVANNPDAITLSHQNEVRCQSDRPEWLQIDGEALEQVTSVQIRQSKAALRVLTCV
ncbi:MAG: hypothetical protein F2839_03265 [Actinobacteria bacterium]|uniref:Unannotated protein n=1 Tax=freshwater metagenome TaxID=449393 RepID=A0A6J5Z207_9ZZZZ|nr:hypothetical protein [Actinomycetota bacterium]